jgi:predicted RNA-binding Zn-ribbon protein involved in translation (DUF1610 family)
VTLIYGSISSLAVNRFARSRGVHVELTTCPACGELLIGRSGFDVVRNKLDAGKCPGCGRRLAGVWSAGAGGTTRTQ